MHIANLRTEYHKRVCEEIITIMKPKKAKLEYLSFADASNRSSINISWSLIKHIGYPLEKIARESDEQEESKGSSTGNQFEQVTRAFLEMAFSLLQHLRPGEWRYSLQHPISSFDQYEHLADLNEIVKRAKQRDKELGDIIDRVLGGDYIIKPDILVSREPITDEEVNREKKLVDISEPFAKLTPLRKVNYEEPHPILHASISCKWTMRSDRAQNTRTEALNLIRNRKGPLPHVVAITAEPLPTRIASLAQGTGDLDCVYHFALYELNEAVNEVGTDTQKETLDMLIHRRHLRDISDLPFDLAV